MRTTSPPYPFPAAANAMSGIACVPSASSGVRLRAVR
jgi:hypothetical protein